MTSLAALAPVEPPRVEDAHLRAALVAWFDYRAKAFYWQAHHARTEDEARSLRLRAETSRQYGLELEEAARTTPELVERRA